MEIIIAKNKENWPNQGSFAQAWEWGEVLRAEGQEVDSLLVKEGEAVAKAQIVYKSLPFGWRYAWCPKGPVVVTASSSVIQSDSEGSAPLMLEQILHSVQNDIYDVLTNYLKTKKCVFLRCEPDGLIPGVKLLQVKDVNPKTTLILDLSKSLEEILAGMKKNTRYSIRFTEKQNLIIKENKDLKIFWQLMQKIAVRDQFSTHGQEHYESVLTHPGIHQLTAYLGDIPVASAIFLGNNNTFTYLFAASDYAHHKLLAPYLLQWEAIKIAKQMGYKQYDFFGIAPEKKKKLEIGNWKLGGEYEYDRGHHYAGITKFKLGFGGVPVVSLGTFDLVLDQKKYWIYKILHFIYGIRKIGR